MSWAPVVVVLVRLVRCCVFVVIQLLAFTTSAISASDVSTAASQGEQDPEVLWERLLDSTLVMAERLARSEFAKAEEILTSLELSYAGGNPTTPNRYRRRAIKVRQMLLKLHRQQLGDTGEVIERDCYAIAWMSAAVGDRLVALAHHECYYRAIAARLGAAAPKALEARSLYAEALGLAGRLSEAESEFKETISALRHLNEPSGRELASALRSYAELLNRQARFDEYEVTLRQYIAATEATSGTRSEDYLFAIGALINFLNQWDRHDEADALTWQAYTTLNAAPVKDGFMMALASWRAGGAALRARQPDEALQLYRQAYELHLKHMGTEYLHLGSIKVSMAQAHKAAGRLGMAKQTLREAIDFFDQDDMRRGSDFAAQALIELGQLLVEEGSASEAEPPLERAEALLSRLHGGCSSGLVRTALWRSRAHLSLNQGLQSNAALQRALRCARRLVDSAQSLRVDSLDARLALRPFLNYFIRHTLTVANGGDDLFEALQLANVSETSATVARLTSASLTGNADLAALVRRREDLIEQLRGLDRLDAQLDGRLDRELALQDQRQRPALESALTDLDRQLSGNQQYGVRAGRDLPVTVEEVARVLRPREALVVFHFDEEQGAVWVASGTCTKAASIKVNAIALSQRVGHIRKGLELRDGRPVEFDIAAAYDLYRTLFGSIESCLVGAEHLVVVAPAPLGSLPIGVLPVQAVNQDRKTPIQWLLQRYSVSVVPSVATLVALRPERGLRAVKWPSPFFGMGDPLMFNLSDRRSAGEISSLRELPDTAVELRKMASTLGASRRDVLLREAATGEALSRVDLSAYQIIAFATHGLSAAEVKERGEPALVLSPSHDGSSLLLASDIGKLNVTADLVILSACNTAAADGSQRGEWLSGLTRAFFRAGARSVLASHWYVSSMGTTALTTRVLEHYRKPGAPAGKAQALRLAALELIETKDPLLSHPVVWGAFSLVGDGAAAQ